MSIRFLVFSDLHYDTVEDGDERISKIIKKVRVCEIKRSRIAPTPPSMCPQTHTPIAIYNILCQMKDASIMQNFSRWESTTIYPC